jgi:thiol:disulfide interchange protein
MFRFAVAAFAVCTLVACSSGAPAANRTYAAAPPATPPAPSWTSTQPMQPPPSAPYAAPAPRGIAVSGAPAFSRKNPSFQSVLSESASSGRPALLLFVTDWCGYCRKLERETLPDSRVKNAASRYTAAQYDAERGEGKGLADRYGVRGFPALILIDGSGRKVDSWGGYNEPATYAAIIQQMKAGG